MQLPWQKLFLATSFLQPKTRQNFGNQSKPITGDFTEYIPLVPGGHQKNCLLFINVLLKMTKCYERNMEKVIRKHTCQAPRQFIGP